ncbi:MAG: hypothetical protein WD696_04010 [Bryobacteraceae bacterium]
MTCVCALGFAFSANYTNHAAFLALGGFALLALAGTFGIHDA